MDNNCARNKQIWTAICMCWIALQVYAASPENLVQKKLSAVHTMHANFSQTVHSKQRMMSESSGVMVLARPNQFRWQTKHPMEQVVVADGKKVWVYDVDLEQVTVSKQTENLGAAGALFLSQDTNAVQQNFTVKFHQQGLAEIFDLRAKSVKSNFEHVRLFFEKDRLTTIELDDQLGQHTTIRFSQMIMNQPESAHWFQFHIPAGVDVVYQ